MAATRATRRLSVRVHGDLIDKLKAEALRRSVANGKAVPVARVVVEELERMCSDGAFVEAIRARLPAKEEP